MNALLGKVKVLIATKHKILTSLHFRNTLQKFFLILPMEFCRVWMPYCLAKVEDEHGGWIPLNRSYKPLGHVSGEWVDYCSVPPGCRIKRLHPETAAFLSWDGEGMREGKMVFLYNDGSFPARSSSHWNSYSEKLARLARLMIKGR